MLGRRLAAAAVALGALGSTIAGPAVTAAPAPPVVTATASTFLPPTVSMSPGEQLTFVTADAAPHNVVSLAPGLFRSDTFLVGQGPVFGTERLGVGAYAFTCSVHPSMRGTLEVR